MLPADVAALVARLPGGPWCAALPESSHTGLTGHAGTLRLVVATSAAATLSLVAKSYTPDDGDGLPALCARLELQAQLAAYARTAPRVQQLLPADGGGRLVPHSQLSGGRVGQLLEHVPSARLYDLLVPAATAAAASSCRRGDGAPGSSPPQLLRIAHALGVALGRLRASLQRARPLAAPGCRVLAGCDALALALPPPAAAGASGGGGGSGGAAASAAPAAAPESTTDRVSSWDLRHLALLRPHVALLRDARRRGLVEAALAVFDAEVAPHHARTEAALAAGSYSADAPCDGTWRLSWIHGDVNNHNVLVRLVPDSSGSGSSSGSDHPAAATAAAAAGGSAGGGVGSPLAANACDPDALVFIDWDDACFSYGVHDVAIALTYLLLDSGGELGVRDDGGCSGPLVDAACALVRAVSAHAPLRPSEAAALPALIVARLAASLLQSAHATAASPTTAAAAPHADGPQQPAALLQAAQAQAAQHEYVLMHAAPATALLAVLLAPSVRAALGTRLVGAAGLTATMTRELRSYAYAPGLSEAQVRCSATVAAALAWLGAAAAAEPPPHAAAAQLHPVITMTPPLPEEVAEGEGEGEEAGSVDEHGATAVAVAAGKAGRLPPTRRRFFAPPAAPRPWWPRVPFVYDFSAANGASLAGVVGTDPDKLAAFTALMFEPLQQPPPPPPRGAGGPPHAGPSPTTTPTQPEAAAPCSSTSGGGGGGGSGGGSSSSLAALLAPPEPACTPLPSRPAAGAWGGGSGGAGGSRDAADEDGSVYRLGWGCYGEARVLYQSEHFVGGGGGDALEPRTVHLGVDLEAAAGTPVRAPLAGTVHSVARNLHPLDYGPTVVLRHDLRVLLRRDPRARDDEGGRGAAAAAEAGGEAGRQQQQQQQQQPDEEEEQEEKERLVSFYTLYGHLSVDSLVGPTGAPRLAPGDALPAGGVVGWVGPEAVNGGWPPHLHVQLNTELQHGGWAGDYPGVCAASDWGAYAQLCPDPNLLLRCPWVAPVGGAWRGSLAGLTVTRVAVVVGESSRQLPPAV